MSQPKKTKDGKRSKDGRDDDVRSVVRNRRALFEFEVVDEIEAGLVLRGTEVKSLRDGKAQLVDAYATAVSGEIFLHHAHIAEYSNGTYSNHDPVRTRKLLLHRVEIDRLERKTEEKGFTLVPLEIYFRGPRAKVKLGLCRGKSQHDKRHVIRARDERRANAREHQEDA